MYAITGKIRVCGNRLEMKLDQLDLVIEGGDEHDIVRELSNRLRVEKLLVEAYASSSVERPFERLVFRDKKPLYLEDVSQTEISMCKVLDLTASQFDGLSRTFGVPVGEAFCLKLDIPQDEFNGSKSHLMCRIRDADARI